MLRVLLGLGSNLGSPQAAFTGCLERLAVAAQIVNTSRLWCTRAIGPPQPDFLNAAVLIEWPTSLRSLLTRCHELESEAGRDRLPEERWGPRILDIDLLMAKNAVCRGPTLELPHSRFHQRRFALEPATEVAPDWVHPLLGLTIEELAERARHREPDAILEIKSFKLFPGAHAPG